MDFTAVEKYVIEHREEVISLLLDYVMTDTVLFWSKDESLQKLQKQQWLPMITLFNKETDADFAATCNLDILVENEKNRSVLEIYFNNLNKKELSALYAASANMKSVFLGLLLAKNKIAASEAFKKAFLEEMYQNTLWGEEEQALALREAVKKDLLDIEEYLKNG